jgi:hypothetical protein
MTILAVALVSLFDAHIKGLRAAGAASDYIEARTLGEGLLADAQSGWQSRVGRSSGRKGRFDWSIDVAPVNSTWAQIKSQGKWHLNHVRVTVAWDGGRSIELDTLKLGRPHD